MIGPCFICIKTGLQGRSLFPPGAQLSVTLAIKHGCVNLSLLNGLLRNAKRLKIPWASELLTLERKKTDIFVMTRVVVDQGKRPHLSLRQSLTCLFLWGVKSPKHTPFSFDDINRYSLTWHAAQWIWSPWQPGLLTNNIIRKLDSFYSDMIYFDAF